MTNPSRVPVIERRHSPDGGAMRGMDYPRGWNWGAFWLNWVWGLAHNTWIALLMFVPVVNFVMPFILGAKGNEWAWRNVRWRDVEHFKRTQRLWARVGWGVALGLPAFAGLVAWGVSAAMISTDAYQMALAELREHPRLEQALGTPVEPSGWFVSGDIHIEGAGGWAELSFDVAGPKGAGTAFVRGERTRGQWTLTQLSVITDADEHIVLIGSSGEALNRDGGYGAGTRT